MYIMDRNLHSRAWDLAATSHLGQTIPGSDLPYIVHVGRVVMLVMNAIARSTGVEDPDLAVLCAVLHDVMEDTPVGYQQIVDLFGARVADGVAALTKNPDLAGKSERMEDSLRRIRAQPAEIWMVKMADRIVNLRPPPSHWSAEKIQAYRQEAIRIHQALHLANGYLSTELNQAIQAYGAHGVGKRAENSPPLSATLPSDFHLEYAWREGTVPPPYHYEYRILLDASGNAEVLFRPDYPSEQPPEWSESFTVSLEELQGLYWRIVEGGILGRRWEPIPDEEALIGGELESMEIVENGRHHQIPSSIVDASRVESVYQHIRSLMPETIWQSLMNRREAYIRDHLEE
jgi:guanosine-3',5'-bis(diphosphate) 3'-pyrophosphohydrolase